VEKQDDKRVSTVLEQLEKEAHAMASKLYENAGSGGPDAPPGGPTPGANGGAPKGSPAGSGDRKGGDVIDAEFEETSGN
jgi:molecular chaperone DnaK